MNKEERLMEIWNQVEEYKYGVSRDTIFKIRCKITANLITNDLFKLLHRDKISLKDYWKEHPSLPSKINKLVGMIDLTEYIKEIKWAMIF